MHKQHFHKLYIFRDCLLSYITLYMVQETLENSKIGRKVVKDSYKVFLHNSQNPSFQDLGHI